IARQGTARLPGVPEQGAASPDTVRLVGRAVAAHRAWAHGAEPETLGHVDASSRKNFSSRATIHDFVLLNALAKAAPTRATSQAVGFLKSVLLRPKETFLHKRLSCHALAVAASSIRDATA